VIVGPETAGETTKTMTLDAPPPGEGFWTATLANVAEAISTAEIEAVSWTSVTKVVGRGEPFQVTVDAVVKPEPVRVKTKALPPAVAEPGSSLVSLGAGLLILSAKTFVAVAGVGCVLSLIFTVKLKSPDADGVPLKTPVPAAKVIPVGGDPALIDH
jgi:hypothetical protein